MATKKKRTPRAGDRAYKYLEQRRAFIVDRLSLAQIAAKFSNVSERTLERVCSEENWVALREEAWREVGGAKRAAELRDVEVIQTKHLELGQAVRALAIRAIGKLKDADISASELAALVRVATELERKTLGMDEQKVKLSGRLSLTSLADLVNNEPFDDE